MERLPKDADTYEEIFQYYKTRAMQLYLHGYVWNGELVPVGVPMGCIYFTWFHKEGKEYTSFYIPKYLRGQGYGTLVTKLIKDKKIVTLPDCDVYDWCVAKGLDVTLEYPVVGYDLISSYYRDEKTKRTNVFLMNHIDEGLIVLKEIGASEDAMSAYCLHPLVQMDEDLAKNYITLRKVGEAASISSHHIFLTMEYRNKANNWLSDKVKKKRNRFDTIGQPELSPLEEVNQMLIADKVQNYKDFLTYHSNTHKRRRELDYYFRAWFDVLGISGSIFIDLCKTIDRAKGE